MTDGVLIVITTDAGADGEYCLGQIAQSYPVALIAPHAPTWELAHLSDHEIADPLDLKDLRAAVARLAARHRIDGVLTRDEFLLVPAAHVAADLGLPGNSSATAVACRNKAVARAVWSAAGVPSAASERASSLASAQDAAENIGFPVVLKPVAHRHGLGVVKADNADELPAAYAYAARYADGQGREGRGVLVEEYLSGPEVAVQCVTTRGVTTAVALARKAVGPQPQFSALGFSVTADDPLLAEAGPLAQAALDALGIANGISHVQIAMTKRGPRLIDVNARLGDDLVPHLVFEATGIDLPAAAAAIARGQEPDLSPNWSRTTALSFPTAPRPGRLTRAQFHGDLTELPWLERLVWLRKTGDDLGTQADDSPGDLRVCYLVVTGHDLGQCRQRITDATALLDIQIK
ncbi:biotin carboxylase [Kitasatospora sp. MAP12-15]|uniref:ATP-grasp domain-containing protein n=1 Tax=unclassified Kitasatospora TaxID=2633591 RepID=UPI002474E2C8|nr:ATP-grasp domain-containing protein [Kitasatospora sp. MAP12-44]MDH6111368.1 biotin carboxylase [Kitasatospora sp. MAP12-44]